MSDPTSLPGISTTGPGPVAVPSTRPADRGAGADFRSVLLNSLEQVNSLQKEADVGVQKLMTGESDNLSEVLGAIRKADVAFSLLMEIRNKLMDAYTEIKQMRV